MSQCQWQWMLGPPCQRYYQWLEVVSRKGKQPVRVTGTVRGAVVRLTPRLAHYLFQAPLPVAAAQVVVRRQALLALAGAVAVVVGRVVVWILEVPVPFSL